MRRIVCQSCDYRYRREMHPEDAAMGWERRVVDLRVKKPAEHSIQIISDGDTKTEVLPSILCDDCGKAIPDGSVATAVSMWRGGEMGEWEHEYGTVL